MERKLWSQFRRPASGRDCPRAGAGRSVGRHHGRTQERLDNATESVRPEIHDAKISWVAADLATPE